MPSSEPASLSYLVKPGRPPQDAPGASGKPTILLVEDDPSLVRLLSYRLGREGFEVRHAANGREGLDALAQAPLPDVVVLDVMLPILSGFEVLAGIREDPANQRLPVFMLTASSREEDVVRAIRAGATDYLTKPFRPRELVARIKGALARSRA